MMANALLILVTFVTIVLGVLGRSDDLVRLRQRSSMGLDGERKGEPGALTELTKAVEQSLRICNGYAFGEPLDVYKVPKQKLTSKPLAYKSCQDFGLKLQEGDQLDFQAGDLDVGTFFATGVPSQHASLLLIPHRRDHSSLAMAFDSHAFAELQTAQIAVVDAYRGAKEGHVKIMDPAVQATKTKRVEDLNYNSVVALNPGKYQLALTDDIGHNVTELLLNVDAKEKYVAMRVGTDDATANPGYPMELIVFPSAGATCLQMFTAVLVMILSPALWL